MMLTKFVFLILPSFALSDIVDHVYKFKKNYVPSQQHTISYQEEGRGRLYCSKRFSELATFAALAVIQNPDQGYTCRFYQEALVDEALEYTEAGSFYRKGTCIKVILLIKSITTTSRGSNDQFLQNEDYKKFIL